MKFLKVLLASTLGSMIAIGVLFFFGFLFLLAFAAAGDAQPPIKTGSVLTLELAGGFPEKVSGDPLTQALMGESAFDVHGLVDALEAAATDSRIEGLWIRSSGLTESWATLEAVRRAIVSFAASDKPVFASSRNFFMTEAEYFLASAADSVFLDPQSIFEFNGFAMTSTFYADLLEKLDVEPMVVRAGDYKGAVEPYTRTSLSDQNREQLQAILDDIEAVFANRVAESRNMSVDDVMRLLNQDIMFSATEAFEAGLVDDLLYNDQVRALFGDDEDDDITLVPMSQWSNQVRSSTATNKIAVVHVSGTMMPGSSDAGGLLSTSVMSGSDTIVAALRTARDRRGVKALVVRIDSPGGMAPAADAMLREIQRTAEEMPVIISMGDVAASGGYWIATGGDHIVAESTTITGSIGVFSMFFDASELFEARLGITNDVVASGASADMFSGMRSWSDAERAMLERTTDTTYQAFLQHVATARNMSTEEAHALARGRVWTGSDAFAAGLVDEIGGMDIAIERAIEQAELDPDDVQVVRYPRSPTFFDQLSLTSAVSMNALSRLLGNDPGEATLVLQAKLQEFAAANGTVQARMTNEFEIR